MPAYVSFFVTVYSGGCSGMEMYGVSETRNPDAYLVIFFFIKFCSLLCFELWHIRIRLMIRFSCKYNNSVCIVIEVL